MKNKKLVRIFSFVFLILAVLYCGISAGGETYIKDFKSVSQDYDTVTSLLYDYYEKADTSEKFILDIDNSDYSIKDDGIAIDMNMNEKDALKRACETSYSGRYDIVWVTENDVIFWTDETKTYGIIHTNNFSKSKRNIKEWYDGIQFRKIQSGWYELGHFGI